ncbi:hypothetical protein ACFLZW_00160 [Chloroflexota bacterium]
MNATHTTGLGNPEPVGKKTLFQPPVDNKKETADTPTSKKIPAPRRVRTTIGLTNRALAVIQQIQHQHRLKTGTVLPLWKLVSRAVERYGDENKSKDTPEER